MAKTDDTSEKKVNAEGDDDSNESKNQVTTYLSDLHQFDAHFQNMPQRIVKGGLKNMSSSEWAKLQKKWEDLQLAKCELELKRSKLVVYSTELLLKAASATASKS